MANIKRKIAFTKGLPEALADRISRTTDIVTDVTLIDGTATYDEKYVSANAFKDSNDLNLLKTSIVDDISTIDGSAQFDETVVSANAVKALSDVLDGLSGGIVLKGSFDIGVETVFPVAPVVGDLYKIVNSIDAGVSVTIDGIILTQNDSIFFDGTNWFKTDNTESSDILRDGDVSTDDTDFVTVDPTLLSNRLDIDTYVKTLIAAVTVKPFNDTVVMTGDAATLTHDPLGNVITHGVIHIDNTDGTFDIVECTCIGTTLTISPDVAGEYTGLSGVVHYLYI